MNKDREIFKRVHAYVAGNADLTTLYEWVMDNEPWGSASGEQDAATKLAAAVQLHSWEHFDGHRDEASLRQLLQDEIESLSPVQPRA